ELESRSANVLRDENAITQLRGRLAELEHQISQSQHSGLELKSQFDRHESRIQFNQERLEEIQAQQGSALSDISQSEERRSVAEQELSMVAERFAASTRALELHRQALLSKQEALRGVESRLAAQQEVLRKAQADAFSAAQQLSRVRNEITALDLQKQGNL